MRYKIFLLLNFDINSIVTTWNSKRILVQVVLHVFSFLDWSFQMSMFLWWRSLKLCLSNNPNITTILLRTYLVLTFFGLLFIEVMIVLYSMHFNSILFKNETICTKWILSRYQNWTEIIKWYLLVQYKQNWHIFFILTQFKWDFDFVKW